MLFNQPFDEIRLPPLKRFFSFSSQNEKTTEIEEKFKSSIVIKVNSSP